MSTERSSHWSLTINNPTAADYEQIELARQRGWKVEGQQEVGKEGTPHLQLHLATPQVRFSAVKKAFPRAHIEAARNPQALAAYVTKEETRAGSLPTQQEKYPSLSKFWKLIYDRLNEWNWISWSEDQPERWWKDAFDHFSTSRFDYDDRPPTVERRREFAMLVFDEVVECLIREGYHVDQFYSPPNMNLWKKFHFAILHRCWIEKDIQTARQTDARSDDGTASVSSEHNHAPEVLSQEARLSPPPPPCPTCGKSHNSWQAHGTSWRDP